jgi:uncharacterized protein YabN with tetrapyrrole methylase and pyrophosphatase domain
MDLLEKVERLEHEADDFGFRWETTAQIMAQIHSECGEIEEHLAQANCPKLQEEIGDLLHAVFSLTVFCNFSAKETLEKTLIKFERRLNAVKQLAKDQGLENLNGYSFKELMDFWNQAKRLVG